jgi:uncharacterized coiled-coil protein SlyX
MDGVKQMFRKIINGQSAVKSELLGEINKLRVETQKGFDGTNNKIDVLDKKLTKRIDKVGLQVARLEDDTPTVDEFDKLEHRVTKVEQKVASI